MNGSEHEKSAAKDILRQAFQRYKEYPDSIVSVADQILCAATKAAKLDITPTSSGKLAVTIDGDNSFDVDLPYDSVSSFRTLLARFGVICGAAAEKCSLTGNISASMKRIGLLADKTVTERKDRTIECVRAVLREQPGSPLYKVDADLDVKLANGVTIPLHLTAQNDLKQLFLRIEHRKARRRLSDQAQP